VRQRRVSEWRCSDDQRRGRWSPIARRGHEECMAHKEAVENPSRGGGHSSMRTAGGDISSKSGGAGVPLAVDKRRWGEEGIAARSNGRENRRREWGGGISPTTVGAF
jgi:hypothetical protein